MRKIVQTSELKSCAQNSTKNELKRKKRKVFTPEEIRRGLRLKFACGRNGYQTVLEELGGHVKQPSLSTLYRHTSQYKFEPGLVAEIFEMLKMKVKAKISQIRTKWR